jgi:hypothetical protein
VVVGGSCGGGAIQLLSCRILGGCYHYSGVGAVGCRTDWVTFTLALA